MASILPPQAELETTAVDRLRASGAVWGSGIFGALLGELRVAGATELLLEVRASNLAALAFYRAQGFVETGRRIGYYTDPIEDAVLMQVGIG